MIARIAAFLAISDALFAPCWSRDNNFVLVVTFRYMLSKWTHEAGFGRASEWQQPLRGVLLFFFLGGGAMSSSTIKDVCSHRETERMYQLLEQARSFASGRNRGEAGVGSAVGIDGQA